VSVKRNPGRSHSQGVWAQRHVNLKRRPQERLEELPSAKDGKPHNGLSPRVSKLDEKTYELLVKARTGTSLWKGPIDGTLLDDIAALRGSAQNNGVFTFKFFSLAP